MGVNIFLDDERGPLDVYKYTTDPIYRDEEWMIVRDYETFERMIKHYNTDIDLVSLDHDLAPEHYRDYVSQRHQVPPDEQILHYEDYKEKTGYDCAKFLIQYCHEHGHELPQVRIHSMNVVGKQNILFLLNGTKKAQ